MDLEKVKKNMLELVGEMTEQNLDESAFNDSFETLGVDSLMALELAVHLEREFGVRLSEDELAKLENMNDILKIIEVKGK